MKLKVLVCGCPLSVSGYGQHARTVLNALKTVEENIDLYVMPLRFANTSNTYSKTENVKWYLELMSKFNQEMLGHFDISIQIGVPPEWKRFGKYNIGITAGTETLSIPPEWIDYVNSMEKVITISQFSKRAFVNTVVEDRKCSTQIDVIPYPVKSVTETEDFEVKDLTTDFNFLSINQWAPRKNVDNLIKWFIQEFKNEEKVGLILKTYTQSNSTPDYHQVRLKLFDLISQFPDMKCKIYLIHGDLSDEQINSLFLNKTVKAYINNAHGEGFGLSIFDAACNGVPVIAPDFSGYKDYLYQEKEDKNGKLKLRPFFQKVSFDINPIQQEHFMPNILTPNMVWAYPHEKDFKHKIRDVYKDYGRFKKQAEDLKKILLEKYTLENINKMYIDSIFENVNLTESQEEIIEID